MKKLFFSFILSFWMGSPLFAQEEELTEMQRLEQRTQLLQEAVEKLNKLKISGYIQAQYQHGEKDASLKVGGPNTNPDEGFDRFGIRRGRLKFVYTEGIASGVYQLEITEKGVSTKDAYIDVKDPWLMTSSVTAGMFDRPFGYEVSFSSSKMEALERSTIVQTLFPDEKDMGAALTLRPAATSPFYFLKLQGGLFAGNATKIDVKNTKDFIGRLSASKAIGSTAKWGVGVSYYNGRIWQGNKYVYSMSGASFAVDSAESNKGSYAKREYFGVDAQFNIETPAGLTQFSGEYIFGQQPGTAGSSKSPAGDLYVGDTYIRDFRGGYIMLVQDLGPTPFSLVGKYEYYDPNTNISGNEVGTAASGTSKTDLVQSSFLLGALWRVSPSLLLAANYSFNSNEKSNNVSGFDGNREDDVFTLRFQYKF